MTSQPEVPGADAVYLNREETANDVLHVLSVYARIKVLNDAGKTYANVVIPYLTGQSGLQVDEVAGRTIHPDGTIVSLTDKPHENLLQHSKDYETKETIFTLPSVEVGSILEYRYKLRFDDRYVRSPDWIVQTNLYTRQARFLWRPTDHLVLVKGEAVHNAVAWTPILPPGAVVRQTVDRASQQLFNNGDGAQLELIVHDIPPISHEEFTPPLDNSAYKVLFYYTPYRTPAEYWKAEGKDWSGIQDKFIGPNAGVVGAVHRMVAPGDSSEQKLRRFYAAIMEMENTDFTRARSKGEDKANGLVEVKTADDILARKRGSPDDLTKLFVAMARAAGMKAYLMRVPDRSRHLFMPEYLNFHQLHGDVAIVNVDGKERFFDPGSRYCAFGHLSWQHAFADGLRQTAGGIALASTPAEPYKTAHVTRVANLNLDESGRVSGTVQLSFSGDPALTWRHDDLRNDDVTFSHNLRDYGQRMLPPTLDVQMARIDNLTDYDLPLQVTYNVEGHIGSLTGKRMLIPGDLFEVNAKPRFTQEKRELSVDMHFGQYTQDVMHLNLPKNFAVEALPVSGDLNLPQAALYNLKSEQTATSYTIRRNLGIAQIVYPMKNYSGLRTFYNNLQTKDQEPVVLTRGDGAAARPAANQD